MKLACFSPVISLCDDRLSNIFLRDCLFLKIYFNLIAVNTKYILTIKSDCISFQRFIRFEISDARKKSSDVTEVR
jgi:hypothetical protein